MFRRLLTISTLLGLIVAGTPAAAQDWAGKGRAQGSVKDDAGQPIEGATIRLHPTDNPDSGPEPLTTNAKGRWSILGLKGGHWVVLIDAEGYLPSQGQIGVNEFQPGKPVDIKLQPNPMAGIGSGNKLFDEGKYAEARAEYQKSLSQLDDARAARLRSRIGDTYFEEGNYAAARAEYEQALPLIPEEEQVHIRLQLANSYQQEEQFDRARVEYEKVLPSLPAEGQAQILLTIARSYDMQEKREEAVKTLERALEASPGNVQLIQLIADLLTRSGREEEARGYLAQLPEDTALPPDMLLNIGIRLYNEGNVDQAIEYFDRAVRENPELAETYYYRGLCYLSKGENDGAKSDFEQLLALQPESDHAAEVQEFLKFLGSGG